MITSPAAKAYAALLMSLGSGFKGWILIIIAFYLSLWPRRSRAQFLVWTQVEYAGRIHRSSRRIRPVSEQMKTFAPVFNDFGVQWQYLPILILGFGPAWEGCTAHRKIGNFVIAIKRCLLRVRYLYTPKETTGPWRTGSEYFLSKTTSNTCS